jgi:hypothetical protein
MSPTGVALAFELTETGAAMRAQRYRREHPRATEEEVAAVVKAWMLERPGAPLGDAEGVPSTRFS